MPTCTETATGRGQGEEIGVRARLGYNGEDAERIGVGIAAAEYLSDTLNADQRINDRLSPLKEGYGTIMSVYAS
ncbi:unnamed protein product [Heligmosomoides polygyrus]|uniref:Transposase n=1 Tax=Heligmosomoides polygyrus TaxID=6339 RepID=A0A183F4Y0_HELPZ|nr:unnamed protein product [Heligmosomoides polygyrus]